MGQGRWRESLRSRKGLLFSFSPFCLFLLLPPFLPHFERAVGSGEGRSPLLSSVYCEPLGVDLAWRSGQEAWVHTTLSLTPFPSSPPAPAPPFVLLLLRPHSLRAWLALADLASSTSPHLLRFLRWALSPRCGALLREPQFPASLTALRTPLSARPDSASDPGFEHSSPRFLFMLLLSPASHPSM